MEYLLIIMFCVAVLVVALEALKPEWFAPLKKWANKKKK